MAIVGLYGSHCSSEWTLAVVCTLPGKGDVAQFIICAYGTDWCAHGRVYVSVCARICVCACMRACVPARACVCVCVCVLRMHKQLLFAR